MIYSCRTTIVALTPHWSRTYSILVHTQTLCVFSWFHDGLIVYIISFMQELCPKFKERFIWKFVLDHNRWNGWNVGLCVYVRLLIARVVILRAATVTAHSCPISLLFTQPCFHKAPHHCHLNLAAVCATGWWWWAKLAQNHIHTGITKRKKERRGENWA